MSSWLASSYKPRLPIGFGICACARVNISAPPCAFSPATFSCLQQLRCVAMLVRTKIPLTQLLMAAVLGVTSGIYIFRPVFKQTPDNTNDSPETSASQTTSDHTTNSVAKKS